jgi:hypothetical protein
MTMSQDAIAVQTVFRATEPEGLVHVRVDNTSFEKFRVGSESTRELRKPHWQEIRL